MSKRHSLDRVAVQAATKAEVAARRLALTRAQARVLTHVAAGRSNATIAATLDIAERTVETHVTALLQKFGVQSRAELIAFVLTIE